MKYSYIIPYRENFISRKENLFFVLNWVASLAIDLELILVEQDEFSKIVGEELPANCKHVFIENKGLFNKAWGLNVGFKLSEGKAIAFADNDILIDKKNLIEYLEFCCDDNHDAVKPFKRVFDLSKSQSEKVFKSEKLPDSNEFGKNNIRQGVSFCGGLVIFRRNAFEQIGGFDERFIGWGGEDDAMSQFKIPLLENIYLAEDNAFHLWHERSINDSRMQPNYLNNLKLLHEYRNSSKEEIMSVCKKSRDSFGKLTKAKPQKRMLNKFIIGFGTGRCGTLSLSYLLSSQHNTVVAHENQDLPLPWKFSQNAIQRKLHSLRMINGDVGFYYLNYVDFIIKLYPFVRLVCLKRNRNEVIESYMRKTEGRNHWILHKGSTWDLDSKWDKAHPKFNVADKKVAIGMYYDLYYKKAYFLKEKYPNNLEIFDIECLNNKNGIQDILSFCGFQQKDMVLKQYQSNKSNDI